MLADHLVNEGVINKDKDSWYAWDSLPPGKLREDCLCQATQDMELWTNRMDQRDSEDRWEDGEPHTV